MFRWLTLGVASAGVLLAAPAHAAFPLKICSEQYGPQIDVDFGATEFDKNLAVGGHYGLNERSTNLLLVSPNTRDLVVHLLNWNTEPVNDFLELNATRFSGNLGTQWFPTAFPPLYNVVYPVTWNSNSSDTRAGNPRIDRMQFRCKPAAQQTTTAPVVSLSLNTRYDAVFYNDQDVMYFSVDQPPFEDLHISVDVNAATATADFDVYASAVHQRPDFPSSEWRDVRGGGTPAQGSAFVRVPDSLQFVPRKVYFGVTNTSGRGHVVIRASSSSSTQDIVRICTQGTTPQQVMAHPGWPNARESIARGLLRVVQFTNGNVFKSSVVLKSTTGTGEFCNGDSSCDICMPAYTIADKCGYAGQSATSRVRIPNVRCQGAEADPNHANNNYGNPVWFSKVLGHEFGHGIRRLISNFDGTVLLGDQYADTGPQCSHTIMNGPAGGLDTSNRLSTNFNHCKIGDPRSSPICPAKSNWQTLFDYTSVPSWRGISQTDSAPTWLRFTDNVSALNSIAFTAL